MWLQIDCCECIVPNSGISFREAKIKALFCSESVTTDGYTSELNSDFLLIFYQCTDKTLSLFSSCSCRCFRPANAMKKNEHKNKIVKMAETDFAACKIIGA